MIAELLHRDFFLFVRRDVFVLIIAFGMEIDIAVAVNINYRASALGTELVNAVIREIVNAFAVCKINSLIVKGNIVKMVVTAENRIRTAEPEHCFEHIVLIRAAADKVVRLADNSVIVPDVFGVLHTVVKILVPRIPIRRERNMEKNT